ncbi:hypothetical protein HDU99_008712, partial [Rhizoclosmatium hyalinum]
MTIRMSEFTYHHLREQIERHFAVRGTNYDIFYEDAEGKRGIVDEDVLELICAKGYRLYVERAVAQHNFQSVAPPIARPLQNTEVIAVNTHDCMISYSWNTKQEVDDLYDALTAALPGIKIWIDRNEMSGDVNNSMAKGVLKSSVVIACFSLAYLSSKNCNKEINFADVNNKPIIPVYMFGAMTNNDIKRLQQTPDLATPFILTAGKIYADCGASKPFDFAVKTVVKELRRLVPRLRDTSVHIPLIPSSQETALQAWLKPVSFSSDLAAFRNDFVPGTRTWLADEIRDWAHRPDDNAVLWANGAAGTGKSLLSYLVVQHLAPEFITNIFFFCRHDDDLKNTPISVVTTLVWMLCNEFPSFRQYMENEMEKDTSNVQAGLKSIFLDPFAVFQTLVLGGFRHVGNSEKVLLITIDALDELNIKTRESFLRILKELCPKLPKFVKFFVTSRPEKDIYNCLTKLHSFEIEPTAAENKADIEMVVQDRFRKIWGALDPVILQECQNLLVSRSEGVFIYVKLACEYLANSSLTPSQAKSALENFTGGPDGIYAAISQNVLEQVGRDVFCNILGAILFVSEPLDLASIALLSSTPLDQVVTVFHE